MTFKICCNLCFSDRPIRDEFLRLTGYKLLYRHNYRTGTGFYFFAEGDKAMRAFINFIYETIWIGGWMKLHLEMRLAKRKMEQARNEERSKSEIKQKERRFYGN
jgi:hypothetical protein